MLFTGLVSLIVVISTALPIGSLAEYATGSETMLTPVDYFDPELYQISPGDEIWLSFPGGIPYTGVAEAVSVVSIPVSLNGVLSVPGLPQIDTNGMNLQTLQSTIADHAFRAFRGLIVTSGLAWSASFQIPVTGQVINPGIVTVNGLARLTEALFLAGGVTATASSSEILVISMDSDTTIFNINDFLINGSLDCNPLVQRGSRIHVSAATATIIIEGSLASTVEVPSPGMIIAEREMVEFIPGETARNAVDRVGGVSSNANVHQCYVSRFVPESGTVNNIPFSMFGETASVLLQPSDKIVIPSLTAYISITGEVRFNQPVPYSPGMNANYYIAMAGGFTNFSRRNSIKMISSDGSKTDIEITEIVPVGATIEVPRVAVKFWEEYLTILTGIATVIIAYQSFN